MTAVEPYRPRGLIAALAVLICLGVAAVAASVVSAQTALDAKRDARLQNNVLLRELRQQNLDLCLRANSIAAAAGIAVTPCPKPRPIPGGTP